jgi:multidrug efflux pump subunit AcrA (membrane-fusion protein)
MEVEDIGSITVSLGSRQNVLAVPSKAISHVGDQTVVYYLDEDGLRTYKPIETGFVANGMTEILSGLEEGEIVIVN